MVDKVKIRNRWSLSNPSYNYHFGVFNFETMSKHSKKTPLCSLSYVLYILKSGKQTVDLEGDTYHLEAGDILLCQPNTEGALADINGQSTGYVFFLGLDKSKDFLGESLTHLIETYMEESFTIFNLNQGVFEDLIEKFQVFFNKTQEERDFAWLGFLSEIITILYIHKDTRNIVYAEKSMKLSYTLEARIKKYVDVNFTKPLRVEEIADTMNISRSFMHVTFKNAYKMSLHQYLTEVRLNYACHLLKTTNMKVITVAYESGFSSISQFNRAFKQRLKKTPSRYRDHASTN